MSLVNKSFKNNQTGEIVKIIDSYQNIAITDGKEKIDSSRLLDSRYYTEYIDPKSFFQQSSSYDLFAEKIRSVDLSKVPMDNDIPTSVNIPRNDEFQPSTNESAVVMYDPEEEKKELMRKYGAVDVQSAQERQKEAFARIINDDPEVEPTTQVTQTPPTSQVEVKREFSKPVEELKTLEDPILTMFRGAKKNVNFSVNLEIDGKIPRLDFIEMMEDTYEKSIIEFLADEFTNELIKSPHELKKLIISEIKNKVYGDKNNEQPILEEPKEEPKKVVKKAVKRTPRKKINQKDDKINQVTN
jgi:hypothetical protein